MEKTAKITRAVFKNEWSGPKGSVYYHDIELDNGDKGSIGSKEKMPSRLNPGNELTYTIEENPNGADKIKAVNKQQGGFSGGGRGKGEDPKVKIAGFAMAYTKDLIVAGKIETKLLPETFEKMYSLMIAKAV